MHFNVELMFNIALNIHYESSNTETLKNDHKKSHLGKKKIYFYYFVSKAI